MYFFGKAVTAQENKNSDAYFCGFLKSLDQRNTINREAGEGIIECQSAVAVKKMMIDQKRLARPFAILVFLLSSENAISAIIFLSFVSP